jgi:hypothetical protein
MTTKQCTTCKQTLGVEAFSKNKNKADGLCIRCKACAKKNYETNKKTAVAWSKKYYEVTREKQLAYQKGRYKANKAHITAQKKEYRLANPDKINAKTAKRRATKLQATPKWLTKRDFALMESYYVKAKLLELETGVKYHVDHIIPLNHSQVCGLHAPTNLQVITAEENLVKGNTFVVE